MAGAWSGMKNACDLESVNLGFETGSVTYSLLLRSVLCEMGFIIFPSQMFKYNNYVLKLFRNKKMLIKVDILIYIDPSKVQIVFIYSL